MAEGQEAGTQQHPLPCPQIAIRQSAPEHRCHIDKCRVGPIDHISSHIGEAEMIDQVQHQKGLHSIVRKALPHLDKE